MGSFLSEHTAEYVLAPRAAEVLSSHATAAIPIYYWATREGSRVTQHSAADTTLRVLAVFARRPKVDGPHADVITAKLNEELFIYANEAHTLGIPTLAGIPLVASLSQLRPNCPCAWFRLHRGHGTGIEIAVDLRGECLVPCDRPEVTGPTELEALAEATVSSATTVEWEDALERMRCLRRLGKKGLFYRGYNPFHVLLLD